MFMTKKRGVKGISSFFLSTMAVSAEGDVMMKDESNKKSPGKCTHTRISTRETKNAASNDYAVELDAHARI